MVIFPCFGTPASEFIKPDSPPKYFALDIDKTFYSKNEESMSKNIDAFKKAKELGNTLFFCTGRLNLVHLVPVLHEFQKKTGYNGCPGIYSNGALVLDSDCCVIDQVSFSKEFMEDLMIYIIENSYEDGFLFHTSKSRYVITDSTSPSESNLFKDLKILPTVISPQELIQMPIVHIYSTYDKGLDEFKNYKPGIDYLLSYGQRFKSLNPPGVTKAAGITALAKALGVEPSEIAFIGDGFNDIEAMQLSKFSFAMGNAPNEVKEHAKYVLEETCDEAGFAKAMSIVYGV
ncbi:bifunctional HAD-like superfamily/HAD superfamily [Babesia duncani]|uniref:Bifunctional HAD-like superfamily/HAD superfamily n=1 Tax=Babesia duncani TaxID=323732 RepID=A0AAD9PMJ9_9APIC|nr:bifunctional HAD-like superfamily/HAD superfamily [Babesia duncani]KAK2197649.1 bifunctional HAD-like superfamily/HAD superfamily [Babesia duncani]